MIKVCLGSTDILIFRFSIFFLVELPVCLNQKKIASSLVEFQEKIGLLEKKNGKSNKQSNLYRICPGKQNGLMSNCISRGKKAITQNVKQYFA